MTNVFKVHDVEVPLLCDVVAYERMVDAYDGDMQAVSAAIDGNGKNLVRDTFTLLAILANEYQEAHGLPAKYTREGLQRMVTLKYVKVAAAAVRKEIMEGMRRENVEDEPEKIDITLEMLDGDAGKNA